MPGALNRDMVGGGRESGHDVAEPGEGLGAAAFCKIYDKKWCLVVNTQR